MSFLLDFCKRAGLALMRICEIMYELVFSEKVSLVKASI